MFPTERMLWLGAMLLRGKLEANPVEGRIAIGLTDRAEKVLGLALARLEGAEEGAR
jgi:hypothetical protein